MKNISVIVPVYNVEDYLDECINSIINQTLDNIEIILVDDGSTDNSGLICDKYEKMYSNIKTIHKQNGGLSSARNAGIEISSGKYIMFCDSDDYYFKDTCKLLYNEIEDKCADYVIGNYQNCKMDGTLWENPVFNKDKYINFKLSIKDYKNSFFIMNSSVCNKIFRKEFIDKLNLKFVTGIPAEDAVFTTYCFINSNNVYYINDVIYAYRKRNASTSISTNNNYEYFKGINEAYKIIYNNFKESNNLNFYRCFYAKSMTYILYKFIDSNQLSDEDRIDIISNMRWFYKLSNDLSVPACQESLSIIIDKMLLGEYKDVLDICKVIADIRKNLPNEIKEKMSKPQPEMYNKLLNEEIHE